MQKFHFNQILKFNMYVNWVVKSVACNFAKWQHFNLQIKQIFTAEK